MLKNVSANGWRNIADRAINSTSRKIDAGNVLRCVLREMNSCTSILVRERESAGIQSRTKFRAKKKDDSFRSHDEGRGRVLRLSILNPRRSGGQQNDGNWESNRIEFAKFRGPVLNGIACFCCPARSIYR